MKLFYYKFEYLEPDILQFATEQYVGLYKTTLIKTLEYAQRYTECVMPKSQHVCVIVKQVARCSCRK